MAKIKITIQEGDEPITGLVIDDFDTLFSQFISCTETEPGVYEFTPLFEENKE